MNMGEVNVYADDRDTLDWPLMSPAKSSVKRAVLRWNILTVNNMKMKIMLIELNEKLNNGIDLNIFMKRWYREQV